MTRHANSTVLLFVATAVLLSLESAGAANLERDVISSKKHRRLASLEHLAYSPECRTGWWQTLRYGYMRPLWATRCR